MPPASGAFSFFSNFFPIFLAHLILYPYPCHRYNILCGALRIKCGDAFKIYGGSPSTCFFALCGGQAWYVVADEEVRSAFFRTLSSNRAGRISGNKATTYQYYANNCIPSAHSSSAPVDSQHSVGPQGPRDMAQRKKRVIHHHLRLRLLTPRGVPRQPHCPLHDRRRGSR